MNRTRRFLGGVLFAYLSQALMLMAGLWLTPFLLARIGEHEYGLWLVAVQFTFYLGLLDIGVVALLPRTIAYATGRVGSVEAATDLPEIIGQTAHLVLWQMPAVVVAGAVIFFLIPVEWAPLRWPLGLIILTFVAMFPFRLFHAVLQGLQDLSFTGIAQIGVWAINIVLSIILVLAGWRLGALALGWGVAQTLLPLLAWYRLRKRFPAVLPSQLPRLAWRAARGGLAQGSWVSVSQIAQILLSGTDLVIVGKVLGPVAVVPYACTSKLISILANQPNLLMQAALPALSEMRESESRERLFQVLSALSLAVLLLSGAIGCIALVVNQGFVAWWVGADQFGGMSLTVLFALVMLLRHWNTTWIYTLFCLGYERRLFITNLLEGVVAVMCTTITVKLWGAPGGPLGAILGVCLVSLPANLRALIGELNIGLAELLKTLWPWFWRFLFMAGGAASCALLLPKFPFYLVGLLGAGMMVVYCTMMLPVLLSDPLATYVRSQVGRLRMWRQAQVSFRAVQE